MANKIKRRIDKKKVKKIDRCAKNGGKRITIKQIVYEEYRRIETSNIGKRKSILSQIIHMRLEANRVLDQRISMKGRSTCNK